METRSFTLGIALVVLLAGAGNSAEAKTKHFRCTFSGTFVDGVETHIDTDGDGISAGTDQGLENCNIGRFFFQEEAEYSALPSPRVTCPAGTLEFHLVQDHVVSTEEKTSAQIFSEQGKDGATLCFNPSDLTFSATGHGTITGGTGHFTGATGSFESHATGKILVFGMKAGVPGDFGQFSSTNTGTLILPEGEESEQDGD